jgi:urease accessory protein
MLRLTRLVAGERRPDATLTLPWDIRHKSRFRAKLDDGSDTLVQLARGTVLSDGDVLAGDDDISVLVCAALEPVSMASTNDRLLLVRAAYHLGNRHIPLQITTDRLIYQPDHVLDAMLRDLGLDVRLENHKFQPEGGAYSHGTTHEHEHEH